MGITGNVKMNIQAGLIPAEDTTSQKEKKIDMPLKEPDENLKPTPNANSHSQRNLLPTRTQRQER
jgi:hypothetical protein